MQRISTCLTTLAGDKDRTHLLHQDHIDLVHRIIAGIHRVMHLTIPVNMRTDHRIREQVTFPRRYLIDMQLQHVSCLCDNLLDLIILEPKHHFFPVFFVILEHANLIQIPQQTDGIAKLIDV